MFTQLYIMIRKCALLSICKSWIISLKTDPLPKLNGFKVLSLSVFSLCHIKEVFFLYSVYYLFLLSRSKLSYKVMPIGKSLLLLLLHLSSTLHDPILASYTIVCLLTFFILFYILLHRGLLPCLM